MKVGKQSTTNTDFAYDDSKWPLKLTKGFKIYHRFRVLSSMCQYTVWDYRTNKLIGFAIIKDIDGEFEKEYFNAVVNYSTVYQKVERIMDDEYYRLHGKY